MIKSQEQAVHCPTPRICERLIDSESPPPTLARTPGWNRWQGCRADLTDTDAVDHLHGQAIVGHLLGQVPVGLYFYLTQRTLILILRLPLQPSQLDQLVGYREIRKIELPNGNFQFFIYKRFN